VESDFWNKHRGLKGEQMPKRMIVVVLSVVFVYLSVGSAVFAWSIPDTGQTTCYDNAGNIITCPNPGESFYGQDGNYTINPPSYTKLDISGNVLDDSAPSWAMVRDNVTGLIWEVKTDDGSIHDRNNVYDLLGAQEIFLAELKNTRFGGRSNWRLPTINELFSIADLSRSNPTLNTGFFPNTVPYTYTSATINPAPFDFVGDIYGINFSSGDFVSKYRLNKYEGFDGYVRAVCDSELAGSFNDNKDGTVTDSKTGLMWQQAYSGPMSWQEAFSYCENLELANFSDWRLPTTEELKTIIDHNETQISINLDYFPKTPAFWFCSSTLDKYEEDLRWSVDFQYGYFYVNSELNQFYVRAVRQDLYKTSFNDNKDGTVTDSKTGLMWQQAYSGPMSWQEAFSYCENLELANFSDWRLPTIKELTSIVTYGRHSPTVYPDYFFGITENTMENGLYWSSTSKSSDTAWAYSYFYTSLTCFIKKTYDIGVRSVRGGQNQQDDRLTIRQPTQASTLIVGESSSILWNTLSIVSNVKISLSRDGGKSFEIITPSTDNDGSFMWEVTPPTSVNCVLQIEPLSDPTKFTSLGFFSIQEAEQLHNEPPSLDPIQLKTANESQLLEFCISATDPDGDSLRYSAEPLPVGATIDESEGVFSWTPSYDQAGEYQVTFGVTDDEFSDSQTITISVNNVNRPPILNSVGNKEFNEGIIGSFQITASDEDNDSLSYSVSNLPEGAYFSTVDGIYTFIWEPNYEQARSYSGITFTVFDGGDTDSETITITVKNTNRPPTANAISQAIDEDTEREIILTGTDPENDPLTYSTTFPENGSLSGTPPNVTYTPNINYHCCPVYFAIKSIS
jgi:hypothetical protein